MCHVVRMEEKIVLCGANAYDKKYYFNQKFDVSVDLSVYSYKVPENYGRIPSKEEFRGKFQIVFTPRIISSDEFLSAVVRLENADYVTAK